ncbi:MAG: urate hydroxylase PuuD [Pseudomonadota bacterium]
MDFLLNIGQWDAWASLVFRWAHIIAGISWIGSSFYFMALDYSLRRREGQPAGVKGETWQVHGGGFYHIQKYMVAPDEMPGDLHWFKWESYLTWITGFALLCVLYYWQAEIYLIDPGVNDITKPMAIGLSIGSLVLAWIVYDLLCKSPLKDSQIAMFAVLFALIVAASYALNDLFASRAAYLHVGAMIATAMTGNVFFVIIPNQRVVVADLLAGRTPDPKYGQIAKLRSTHNNYLTLPVIFMMISSHYPMTYGHPMGWLVIAFILPIGAIVREYFNAYDRGVRGLGVRWQWPAASLIMLCLMIFVAWRPAETEAALEAKLDAQPTLSAADMEIVQIVNTRCAVCHASRPTDWVDVAPAGVILETHAQIMRYAPQIKAQAITADIMPPGNASEITDEERLKLGQWIEALEGR